MCSDDSAAHKSWGNGVNSFIDVFQTHFSTTFISLISIWQQSAINEARAQLMWPRQMIPLLNQTRITGVLELVLLTQTTSATWDRHVSPICQGQYIGTKLSWQTADKGTAPWVYKIKTNKQSAELTCCESTNLHEKIQQYRCRQGASHGKLPSVSYSQQEINYKWQEAERNEAVDFSLDTFWVTVSDYVVT